MPTAAPRTWGQHPRSFWELEIPGEAPRLAGGSQQHPRDLRSRFPAQRQHYGALFTPSKESPEGRR